ncbi:hypothetical protein Fmac_031361 [Flemingia macrophylla]|uniref:NB-ARC domain-containing protein n=1 Tax=Flemingia macrophylla TaxID=520843 RepID=A0ABD1L1V2_9FABA
MERVRFEDACANFVSLLDSEVGSFCVSRIKQRAGELSRAVDLMKEEHHVELKDALSKLLEFVSNPPRGLFPKKMMFGPRLGRRLKEIEAKIPNAAEISIELQARSIEWDQVDNRQDVLGRESHVEKIVSILLNESPVSRFSYTIVGPGGVGKTTVAQLVYTMVKVRRHFDERIWISVSNNFSIKKILCSIIESVSREKYGGYDLDVIERKVRELLGYKKYLLVLDNLCLELADKLKSVLACGSKGSFILITTRDEQLAKTMKTTLVFYLTSLTLEDTFGLFLRSAFRQGEPPANLIALSREIVNRTMGSPLEARALGTLLRFKREEWQWLKVLKSWRWDSPDDREDFGWKSLTLSYSELARTSRLCFAFCAIFPPNTEIVKEDLIRLWMANGFISSGENLEAEQVGDIICKDLYEKSFFTDVTIDDYSGDISFKMLDHVHRFARFVSGQECVILDNLNMTDLSSNTLHVGFGSDPLSFNKEAFHEVKFLQTLYQSEFAFCNTISGSVPTSHSLRVLRTSFFKLSSLGNLIHLRYLELYGFEIKKLPDSIYNLKRLETLKLTSCRKLVCLPKYLTHIHNLRHIVINECHSLSRMSPNMRKLSCLRTLSLFIVSSKTGHKLEEIGGLNLVGKLRIEGLKYVANLSEAEGGNLMGKTKLHELCLSWDIRGESKSNITTNPEEVLQALQPPPNLKTLRIYDYEGSCLPSWIQGLKSLVALELFDCKNCWNLPLLGKLPSLRKLEVFSMDDVQYIDDDESCNGVEESFPSLEQLDVRGLPNLQQLLKVEREKMFHNLSKVIINDCSKLRLPFLRSIEQLNIRGCNHGLLQSISSFYGLTFLNLSGGEDLSSLPEGMLRKLTSLKTMILYDFPKLKVLPDELFKLNTLERLEIKWCGDLGSLPEREEWTDLLSLRYLEIAYCRSLRSLPKGVRQVTSLEVLKIECCPDLEKRCKMGTGEDWDKIAHIPEVILLQ